MAQHDYNIANQSGADFRADLNNALLAIATVNSGSTEPSTTFAHQLWVDTSSSVLKIRNAADNAWITTGVSITASNTFTGDLTGNVTGNLTGNVTGNVTGDLTGNADSADILTTARTISLSGDVVGSVSFDGSTNVDIDTVVQINSITLGTDTTGDYVESMSGGTGVTVTGGTGEGSTPSIAIGQAVATTNDVTFNTVTATDEFIGDIDGSVRFTAKADEVLSKGDIIYVSGVSGNTPTVGKAKADDASKMPAFGIAAEDANANTNLQIVTLGNLINVDTSNESVGEILYVSTTAGEYSTTAPTGEYSQIQNIGKVLRSHAVNGSIKVGGAGRSNATPNLDNGKIFIGNGSNQSTTATLDTSIVVENTNLYYTTARANTDFDSRLATKDTGDLTEGSNLYYTTARVNTDFDTRLATKDTGDLSEGSNLYYTDARVNSAFDTRLATKDTDDVSEGTTNLYYTTSRTNTDFDTRLATKSTSDLAEGTNLYYTSARFDSAFTSKDTDDLSEGTTNLYYTTTRFDSAFGNKTTADLTENTNLYYTDTRANSAIDARVTKAFVDALNVQAASVDANSVTLGTDTVGNYIQTITGTANKITVSGSGSESADVTLSLPDDVQIADSLTVAGNLTVNGTLTSLDTTNLDIEDNLFQLNAGLTGSPVNDSGMLINRGTSDNSIFMWDESVDKFTMGLTTADGSATGNITLNSLGTLVVNVEGNLTGAVTGTVSSLSNHDTDDLTEGSNLYYTQARFDSAFTAKSTSDLSEGTNLYYTDARFDTRLASKDTDDVSEGTSNLYYTSTRFDSAFGGKSTSDLSEGTNLYYTDARVQAISINNVVEDTTPQLGGDLASNGNDILFADNDKAVFGTGNDLQIFHNGTTSYIRDVGDGDLQIFATDDVYIRGYATNNYMARFNENGAVTLYHNNSPKLATTSTGIDVTGVITSDGLTLQTSENTVSWASGNGVIEAPSNLYLRSTGSGTIYLQDNIDVTGTATMDGLTVDGTSDLNGNVTIGTSITTLLSGNDIDFQRAGDSYLSQTGGGSLFIRTNDGTSNKVRLNVSPIGDISFYEDTGTTAKLFWDASAESLAIGHTNPSSTYGLDVAGAIRSTGNAPSYTLRENDASNQTWLMASYGGTFAVRDTTVSGTAYPFQIEAATPTNTLFLDSSGNVGIGTSSPSYKLVLRDDSTSAYPLSLENNNIGTAGVHTGIRFGYTAGSYQKGAIIFESQDANGRGKMYFAMEGTANSSNADETDAKMTIDYSGKVGIGTDNPLDHLHINDDSGDARILLDGHTGYDAELKFAEAGVVKYSIGHDAATDSFIIGTTNVDTQKRLVIDSSGNLLVGVSTFANNTLGVAIRGASGGGTDESVRCAVPSTGSTLQIGFYNANGRVGSVSTSGTSTAFNTSSDYRLKENVDYDFTALDRVAQLKPARFNFIADADTTVDGFLAHEVQDIIPEAVTGEKDAVKEEEYEVTPAVLDDDGNVITEAEMGTREVPDYQGIDQSKLVPLLTKAIQEQQELINNLTARIEQLEN